MVKKILIIITNIIFICHFVYSQVSVNNKLVWECFDSTTTMKFKNMEDVDNWACHTLPFANIQSHHFSIGGQDFILSCVSGCSGVYCFKIHCFAHFGCWWYLTASAFTRLDYSINNYNVDKANSILFVNSNADTLGSLSFETATGKYHQINKGCNIIFFRFQGDNYLSDIDNNIFYKIDSCVTIPSETNEPSSNLISEDGTIYKTEGNIRQTIVAKQILKKNISIGYFNPSMSPDNKNIVCEQRICHKKNILKCNIVEINADSHVIKVLSSGYEPHYSPLSDRYILFHSDYYFYIFDTILNESILSFSADVAEWCPLQ